MKKVISISALMTALFLVFASPAFASGGNGHHKHHKHHYKQHYKHHKRDKHHHHHYYNPPRRYYDDHHHHYRDARYRDRDYRRYRDRDYRRFRGDRYRRDRDNNTLFPTILGGGIGGAAGYGLSGGDGIFTGLGAAAGAYIGHELAD